MTKFFARILFALSIALWAGQPLVAQTIYNPPVSTAPALPYAPVLLVTGDSQSAGNSAPDQATAAAAYPVSDKVKTLTYAGAWVTYDPAGVTGVSYNANVNTVGPELGFIKRFRAVYPNDTLYIIREGWPGSFQGRGVALGTSTVSGAAATLSAESPNMGNNVVFFGTGIASNKTIGGLTAAAMKPFNGFICSVGAAGGNSAGSTFSGVTATYYNGTQSWSSNEGLIYNGSACGTDSGVRQRVLNGMDALAQITPLRPQLIEQLLVLGTNDYSDTTASSGFQTNTTNFLTRLRGDLPMTYVKTVAARIRNVGSTNANNIRSAMTTIKGADKYYKIIDMDAQTVAPDATHWYVGYATDTGLTYMGRQAFDIWVGVSNGL